MILPVQRRKISEHIFEEIKTLIKNGTYPLDTKLPSETELAKMFQVSRAPVREAISVLAASGMVESRQGGGNWVRQIELANMLEHVTMEMVTPEQVFDLLELRTIVESEAAYLAAERHKQEDIEQLEAALHTFGTTMLGDETSVGDAADYHFHKIIVNASYNPFIVQTMENIADLYQKALTYSLKKNVGLKMKRKSVYKEHEAIFEAIKNRKPEQAAEYMKKHLQTARHKLGDKRVKMK
ncbi:FadR family transcriptional regulator [bacterium LRH843]|nr:FadR family transcriptional regulator [bacterium LRH843]